MDLSFVRYLYFPTWNVLGITDKKYMKAFVLSNPTCFPWLSAKDFVSTLQFDADFYVHYNNLFDYGIDTPLKAIYYYYHYGQYLQQPVHRKDVKRIAYPDPEVDYAGTSFLLISHDLSCSGAPLVVLDVAVFLRSRGADVTILNLNPSSNALPIPEDISVVDRLENYENYDVIVVNTIDKPCQEWLQNHLEQRRKVVLWIHETASFFYTEALNGLNVPIVLYDSYHIRNTCLAATKRLGYLHKVLYLANQEYVQYDPTLSKTNIRKKYGFTNDDVVYINLGSLSSYVKNQIEIVCALEYAIMFNLPLGNIHVCFVQRPTETRLQAYINHSTYTKMLQKHVHFLPYLPHDQCNEYYCMADVYVSCNHNEAYGRVLIEAMEWKLPIIAYQGGSHMELVKNGFNGHLYTKIDELFYKMCILRENREKRERMGKNGYLHQHQLTKGKAFFYSQLIQVFRVLLEQKPIPTLKDDIVHVQPMPELSLLEACVYPHGEHAYIFGGYDNKMNLNCNVLQYTPATKTLTKVAPMPSDCAKTHGTIITNGPHIFILSGQAESGYGESINSFYLFDIDTLTFTNLGTVPFYTYCSPGFLRDNTLVVIGSTNSDRATMHPYIWTCDVYCLEGEERVLCEAFRWKRGPSTFPCLCHASSVHLHRKSYVLGGHTCHALVHATELRTCTDRALCHGAYIHEKVSVCMGEDLIPTKISDPVHDVSHNEHSTFAHDGLIFMLGGQLNNDHVTNVVQVYYPSLDVWFELEPFDKDILGKGCIAFVHAGQLYLAGGQYGAETGIASGRFNTKMYSFQFDG